MIRIIRISTTTLEAFRRVLQEERGSEAELVASIRGEPFERKWQMDAGTRWHEILADPDIDVSQVPPVTDDQRHALLNYQPEEGNRSAAVARERLAQVRPIRRGPYSFSENAVALARQRIGAGGVWEVKATRTFHVAGHLVVLVAQADYWRGLELHDAKATWSNPSLADYEPSLQWRAYLLCHGAESFTYHRFAFRDPKGAHNLSELREALQATFWRYGELERDVKEWLGHFVHWAEGKGLLPFLQRESSTPVYEECAA